jgi:hypothetical protein
MNHVTDIWWLSGQALSGLLYLWPVTLVLVSMLVLAVFRDYSGGRLKYGRRMFYLLLPAIGTFIILVMGSVFEHQPSMAYLLYVAFGVAVLLAITSVVVLRSAWMTSGSMSLCLLWYSFWCWFVSTMSITGDWL